ncbi:MAG: carboxypeptidase regulatory-like domain-containing protein [Vicinamibacterales bacterium]
MVSRRPIAILVTALALATPALCLAQSERGSITGVVEDTTRAPLPGVVVKVINTATNATIEVVSSESGTYSAANLPPGPYRVEAALPGFQSAKVESIRLTAGATARVNVTMSVGAISETVSVVAGSSLMQSQDAKVSTNVSNELIDQLPLVVGGAMRSVFDLVSTVPEAKGSGTNVALGGGQGGAFGATLDGISVNTNRNADVVETAFLTPSVEAITEFAVETNGFKPEFGQAGGGAITFASKSGTNAFQGSLYNFLRNDALDAKGFFEATKGVYRQNNFGGSLGGPIQLPRLYDGKNRTFFFAAYEGFRNNQASNALTLSVPTPEMYDGDFSNWVDSQGRLIVIYDPATTRPNPNGTGFIRDPFPGNRIPANRFSAVARQYLALARSAVVPNRPGLVPGTFGYVSNNYRSPGGTTVETTHKYSLKIDHTLSSPHRLAYLFNRTRNRANPGSDGAAGLPAPFNTFQSSSFDGDLHRGSWDWIIGPRMVNHLSVGVNTFNKNAFSPNVDQNWRSKVCIPNAVDCNQNFGILSFSEFSTWGGSSYNGTEQPRFSIKDDLTLIKGSHTIKSGFTYDRQQANGFGQQDLGGRAGFSFLETAIPGTTTLATGGGSSFASFLLGAADTGRTETIRYLQQIYPYYGFYVQDDWRMTDKLVVNYGVRYEFTKPPVAGGDQYSDFSPTKPNPAVNNYPGALVFAGDGPGREGKRSLFSGYYGALAPRVSFAYSANEKTIVRGGVGRSFGRVTVVQGSSHFAGFIGQYVFSSADAGVTPAFNLDQGLPAYPLPPLIDPAFSNNNDVDWFNGNAAARPATYDNWTISVQREVRKGMTVELDYNGVYGSHLQAGLLNPNQVPMSVVNDLIARFGPAGTVALLNSQITSATAVAAGIKVPYGNFTNPNVQRSRTVAQALRPYPQYLAVNVQSGGGDKTGRSHYHTGVLKVNQRLRGGVSMQSSYTFSKIMTDADSFSGSGRALDAARPELEWSVGRFDQTHSIKISSVVELPFGEGRRWLKTGIANHIVGGWRLAVIQAYSSGFPIGVTTNAPLNIFNGVNRPNVTGAEWRGPIAGDEFNPLVDRFLNRAAFVQPVGALGNAPRINPDVRRFWNLSENVSLAKSITATRKVDLDVRVEVFNIFNRIVWGGPNTDFSSNNFGLITSQDNSPRRMQIGLKLYW